MKIAYSKLFSLFLIISFCLTMVPMVLSEPSWTTYDTLGTTAYTTHTMGYDMQATIGDLVCFVFAPEVNDGNDLIVQVFDEPSGTFVRTLSYDLTDRGAFESEDLAMRLFWYSEDAFGIEIMFTSGGNPSSTEEVCSLTLICDGISNPSVLYSLDPSAGGMFKDGGSPKIYLTQVVKTTSDHYIVGFTVCSTSDNSYVYYIYDMTTGTYTNIQNPSAGYWYGLPTLLITSDSTIHMIAKGLEAYYASASCAKVVVWSNEEAAQLWDDTQPSESLILQCSENAVSHLFSGNTASWTWWFKFDRIWAILTGNQLEYDDAYYRSSALTTHYWGFEVLHIDGSTNLICTSFYWNGTTQTTVTSPVTLTSIMSFVDAGQLVSANSYTLTVLGTDAKYYSVLFSCDGSNGKAIITYNKGLLGPVESGIAAAVTVRYPAHHFQGVTCTDVTNDQYSPYMNVDGSLAVWSCGYAIGQFSTTGSGSKYNVAIVKAQYQQSPGAVVDWVKASTPLVNGTDGQGKVFFIPDLIDATASTDKFLGAYFNIASNVSLNVTLYLAETTTTISAANPFKSITNMTVVATADGGVQYIPAQYQTNLDNRPYALAFCQANQTEEALIYMVLSDDSGNVGPSVCYNVTGSANPNEIYTYSTIGYIDNENGLYLFPNLFVIPTDATAGSVTGQSTFTWTTTLYDIEGGTSTTIATGFYAMADEIGIDRSAFGILLTLVCFFALWGISSAWSHEMPQNIFFVVLLFAGSASMWAFVGVLPISVWVGFMAIVALLLFSKLREV